MPGVLGWQDAAKLHACAVDDPQNSIVLLFYKPSAAGQLFEETFGVGEDVLVLKLIGEYRGEFSCL